MRRRCTPRIIRPRVARISSFHFLLHFRVRAFPEALEVLRDLQRFAAGGEQVQRERHFAVGDARGFCKAEQFLQFYRQHRWCAGFVVNGAINTGGHGDARRRQLVDLLARVPVERSFQCFGEFDFTE